MCPNCRASPVQDVREIVADGETHFYCAHHQYPEQNANALDWSLKQVPRVRANRVDDNRNSGTEAAAAEEEEATTAETTDDGTDAVIETLLKLQTKMST